MEYPDLTESNDVQRKRYADSPVIPNPAPEPYTREELASARDAERTLGATQSKPYDYRQEFGITPAVAPAAAPAPDATPAQPVFDRPARGEGGPAAVAPYQERPGEPVITQDALRPRTDAGNDTRTIDQVNRESRAQLDVINAREAQGLRESNEAMRAGGARAQAGYDLGIEKREIAFDKFRLKNGADYVLAGGDSRKQGREAALLAQRVGAYDEAKRGLEGTGIVRPDNRNLIGEAAAGAAVTDKAAQTTIDQNKAGVDQQKGLIGNAVEQQRLVAAKQLNDLASKLTTAKTPEERAKHQEDLLTILGKGGSNGRYEAKIAPGTRVTDPVTGAVSSTPGYAVVTDTHTGKHEIKQLPADEGGAAQAAPPPNHIDALKKGLVTKEQFNQKYGKNAADQYLGGK